MAQMMPKVYYGLHFVPGVAQYSGPDDRIYISEETAKSMDASFSGKPVYLKHLNNDEITPDSVQNDADGYVVESFYNKCDGKHWAKFIVVSDEAHQKIKDGWRLSNGYVVTSEGPAGKNHNVDYKYEVTGAVYNHLAIVQTPRYEESIVLTPEEFKEYNERKHKEIANSIDEKWSIQSIVISKDKAKTAQEAHKIASEIANGDAGEVDETEESFRYRQADPSKFSEFRTKEISEGVSIVYGHKKDIKNSLTEKFIMKFKFFAKKEIENSQDISDAVVTLKNGKEMSISQLVEIVNGMDEEKEKKEKEAAEKEAKEKAEAEKKNSDEEAAKKKKEEEEEEKKKKETEDKEKLNEIKNAMDAVVQPEKVDLMHNQLARGKSLYGSNTK